MNPLTLVKRIQNINAKEASLGISEDASWHAKYQDSAYVYAGGLPFDLTEGDLLAVFAQYGEIVDVNLVRDKATGKSKGFAFVAYEDQRSTNLAVDNLNGAQILGRTIRVDHVAKYKKMEEEDEETRQQKREERGVCRAFQRGECARGDACKFSHDEQRAANTGWGDSDKEPRWGHEKFDDPKKGERRPGNMPVPPRRGPERAVQEGSRDSLFREKADEALEREPRKSRLGSQSDSYGLKPRDRDSRERSPKRHSGSYARQPKYSDDKERRSRRHDADENVPRTRDLDREEEKRPRRHGDGYEFENNGDGKRNRPNDGEFEQRRDKERSRRYNDDDDVEPRASEKRSSRHDSRDDNRRSDERRSRTRE